MTKEELYYLPTSELLKHIQAEKDRLIKEKVIKKPKPLPLITDEEKPYELPANWEWVRLGDLVSITSGLSYKKPQLTVESNDMVRVLRGGNISDMNYCYKKDDIFISREFVNEQLILKKYDIITPAVTSYEHVGKSALILEDLSDVVVGGFVLFIRGYLDNAILLKNLFYFINTTEFKDICKSITNKSGQAFYNLSREKLAMQLIPLPPLYIQDQIVQKLEQLSETKDSLLSHAESQFNYTKKMREALIQEAIKGELVPQDESDEPASVLLKMIKVEKERLIKEKIIKKAKELPPIPEEEKPYELPSGWEWVRLGNLVSKVGSGSTPKGGSKVYQEYGIKFIRSQNVYNDSLRLDDIAFIPEEIHEKMKGTQVLPNDLLLNITGGSIGRCSLVPQNFDTANVNQHVSIIRLIKGLNIRYFHKVLISGYIQNLIMDVQVGMSREGLSKEKIELFPIPLPPLAEQERIVAKLDELMAHCNQLEAKTEEMKNYTMKLFEAILKEAFIPE